MSRIIGPIRQVGHVVRDVEVAMRYWTEVLGVGPFYVLREIPMTDFIYRGRPSPAPVVTLAFAQSGDVQIELIQQHNDVPSAYREFLSAGREGVQHLSPWFDDSKRYDAARRALLDAGMALVHESLGAGGTVARFCYFETGRSDVPLMELSEALLPSARAVPDIVAAASRDWDGRDPVRDFSFA